MSNTETKTASERLTDLETNMAQVGQALQVLENLARDMMGTKEALKLLNNKVEALTKCVLNGNSPTEDQLSEYMIENNVKELSDKVAEMMRQGILAVSDTVSDDSFVVINEADPSGKIVNPRMQFLVSKLQPGEVRQKLAGSKVGDTIPVGTDGASINVLESYSVTVPQAEAPAAPASDAPTDTASTAAPAETTSADISSADQTQAASG